MEDRDWMAIALGEAERAAAEQEVPIGAVVVLDGRELARAHNQPIGRHDPTAHAEILALRAAGQRLGAYRLPGAVLYATVEPCAMCLGAALHARVTRVVYGAADPKAGAAGSVLDLTAVPALNHAVDVTAGVRAEEGARLLREFFAARRGRAQRTPRENATK
ncbi:MAG: tRNA adenosine(34) deaminase TadA [Deltaproteobacteria bacterium]|nr:tRNA adenosine(34) deaminase TadA [Deltaproteobacteria bacterium]